jgi:hypothetical protein
MSTRTLDGDSGIAAHAHRMTLRGDPSMLDFPPLCARCGAPASSRLPYAKAFTRTHSDSPTEHIVTHVAVPFCAPCTALHGQQSQPPTLARKVLTSFATADMFGAVFPAAAALFVVWLALKDLFNGRLLRSLTMLPIAAVFAAIAWWQRRHVWQETEHLRLAPASEVTRAFDFSDDLAAAFEPPRFVCSMQDARFAEAFRALNRSREWHAGSPQARAERRAASRKMWVIGAIVAALALATLVSDWFG